MIEPDDKFHDECGIFGVFGHDDSAAHTALGLHALQHRGQEAAGIVSFDGEHFNSHRGLGLVGDLFSSQDTMDRLKGHSAIGHNRYSTTGNTVLRNVQPLFAEFDFGGLAVAHNGNLTNGHTLRRQLVKDGAIFHSTTDTEVINHLIANSRGVPMPQRAPNRHGAEVSRIVDALSQVKGAYALIALTSNFLVGARDPYGVRPLVLGNLDGATILASETCALDIIGANFVRDIEPGEVVIIDNEGIQSLSPFATEHSRFCIFEFVYFSRPDSIVEGVNVYDARRRIGMELAREHPVPGADMVTPVPDSGTPGAIGYAAEAGVPFDIGIIRNHYIGRTFIEPADHIRHLGVKLKHNANKATLAGKSVVLVDDSIVRGTTSVKIVEMVRSAGAAEVHMRIASPPTTHSCYYGVDTPDREGLLAATRDVETMRQHIGVDSLAFLSMDGMYRAMGLSGRDNTQPQFCDACFSGNYAIELTDQLDGDLPSQLSLLAEQ